MEIKLRKQKLSDAEKFYEILSNPNFIFFSANPKSVKEEKEFLKKNKEKREKNFAHNFTILYNNRIVGGCGIKINQHRKFIGEIGYFLDEAFWNKGIVTQATKILEKIGFEKLGLKRMEIVMDPRNKGSEKVAIKCGYQKEGHMKSAIYNQGKYSDVFLYAKVI